MHGLWGALPTSARHPVASLQPCRCPRWVTSKSSGGAHDLNWARTFSWIGESRTTLVLMFVCQRAGARRRGASMRWRHWWTWARSRWMWRARAAPRSASNARRRRTARCAARAGRLPAACSARFSRIRSRDSETQDKASCCCMPIAFRDKKCKALLGPHPDCLPVHASNCFMARPQQMGSTWHTAQRQLLGCLLF